MCYAPQPQPHPSPPHPTPPQVMEDMNKARASADDLADVQPDLAGLKPKLV